MLCGFDVDSSGHLPDDSLRAPQQARDDSCPSISSKTIRDRGYRLTPTDSAKLGSATEQIVRMLTSDGALINMLMEGAIKCPKDEFVHNIDRLLQSYHNDLKHDALDMNHRAIADVIWERTKQCADRLHDFAKPGSLRMETEGGIHDAMRLIELCSKRRTLNLYLLNPDLEMLGKASSTEGSRPARTQENLNIENMKTFLLKGTAFSNFKISLDNILHVKIRILNAGLMASLPQVSRDIPAIEPRIVGLESDIYDEDRSISTTPNRGFLGYNDKIDPDLFILSESSSSSQSQDWHPNSEAQSMFKTEAVDKTSEEREPKQASKNVRSGNYVHHMPDEIMKNKFTGDKIVSADLTRDSWEEEPAQQYNVKHASKDPDITDERRVVIDDSDWQLEDGFRGMGTLFYSPGLGLEEGSTRDMPLSSKETLNTSVNEGVNDQDCLLDCSSEVTIDTPVATPTSTNSLLGGYKKMEFGTPWTFIMKLLRPKLQNGFERIEWTCVSPNVPQIAPEER